ncbi:MAG: hypothetical protein AAF328_00320 [Planctomycetota bacterium]
MKIFFSMIISLVVGLHVHAAQFSKVQVSGDSLGTIIDVTTDPAFVQIFTSETGASLIDLIPIESGVQTATVRLSVLNGTGVPWVGMKLVLEDGGRFNEVPLPTLGETLDSSVSGEMNQIATINATVKTLNLIRFDLDMIISGPTRIRATPTVPEPALLAPLLGLCVAARWRRRSEKTTALRCGRTDR